jgi:heat shock protein HtpX
MTLYTHQGENIRKTWLMMVTFFVVVIALGWLIAYIYGESIILYIAVAIALVMNITSYWYSDKIVTKLAHARPVMREEAPVLWNVVENLSITAGLPMPKVYIVDDPVPNAFATGRNKEHAVVAATSGLLGMMNKTELEGVIAHELSHVGNRDMLVSTVAVVLVGFVSIVANIFLRSMMFGGLGGLGGMGGQGGGSRGGRGSNQGANPIIAVIGIVFLILAPIFATLLQLAISRKREYLADASGALLTRYPEGLASALEKIGAYDATRGGQMKHANTAIAHLYLSNPLGTDQQSGGVRKTSWLANLFNTHPPIEDRIRILREG